jgi:MMP 1-O-methyltransferase
MTLERLDGEPDQRFVSVWRRWLNRARYGPLGEYVWRSSALPGWTRGEEAIALARTSYGLAADAVIVEVGSFLGCSAMLLAGARKLRGSGRVHCVDTFGTDGDAFSQGVYEAYRDRLPESIRSLFERNLSEAGLGDWVEIHQGAHADVATDWKLPIDLLFMDADHSPEGAKRMFSAWTPHLRPGGILALHNSCGAAAYAEGHDGSMRLAGESIREPNYVEIHCIGTTTFARRAP